jgi:hypothetical protein
VSKQDGKDDCAMEIEEENQSSKNRSNFDDEDVQMPKSQFFEVLKSFELQRF